MKKIFCMALSAALLAGSVPAYAAEESLFTKTPHTFTARVGTTEFTKDGTAQPLDVPIYIKDSYVMLPLRTFMKALYADAELVWEDGIQLAKVTMLSLIHISEPTRLDVISYAVFCLKKKKK